MLGGAIFFFLILYISLIFNNNIWTDEVFTMQLIQSGWKGIVEGTAADVHPPLYYFIAKAVALIFGKNLQMQKIATIIPMVLTLILGVHKSKKYFGDKAALLFVLCICCFPCTMEFAVQVRMYSLALLFVTASGIYAYEAFCQNRMVSWILFALSCIGAAYTHYFAFVSIIIVNGIFFLCILIRKRELVKKWMLITGVMIVSYLPWMTVFIRQTTSVTKSYWIPEITRETVWGYFTWMFGTNFFPWTVYPFLVLIVAAICWNVVLIARKKETTTIYSILCFSIPVFTMAAGLILSFCTRPIYRDQYILPALGLLSLFLAIVLSRVWKPAYLLICVFLLFVGAVQYRENFRQEYHSTYTKQTEDFFGENLGEHDYIVYNLQVYGFIYEYYFPENQLCYMEEFDLSQDFDTLWVIDTLNSLEYTPEQLNQYGLTMTHIGHFGIEQNEFEIYKIEKVK